MWIPRSEIPWTFDSRAVVRYRKVGLYNDTINNQLIVGHISNTGHFRSAFNGLEITRPTDNVFYLVYHKTAGYALRWIKVVPGLIPTGAVVGGKTDDGYPLYIGWSRLPGSYDARKNCLDVYHFISVKCYHDYHLLLLTSMLFTDRCNFMKLKVFLPYHCK